MRESPRPGLAGGAGLLVGRVEVAIVKSMGKTLRMGGEELEWVAESGPPAERIQVKSCQAFSSRCVSGFQWLSVNNALKTTDNLN